MRAITRSAVPSDGPLTRAEVDQRRSFAPRRRPLTLDAVPDFKLNPAYTPVADQPKARAELAAGIEGGDRFQTLLGVTGSGKTATMAFTIEQVQRPALVIAHNKTLAAQLCNEFREFFPENAVEYFVSYYDYYQPEAYVPAQDLYIEKDSSINEEIDRLRHSATAALFARRDVIVVASVSCIYGLGSPEKYDAQVRAAQEGRDGRPRRDPAQARRHPVQPQRPGARRAAPSACGARRSRSSRPTPRPPTAPSSSATRSRQVQHFDPLTGEVYGELEHVGIWPATHYATDRADDRARASSRSATSSRSARKELESEGKLLESHRLRQRTQFDMEMLRELGFCNGIENYSRILDGRAAGRAARTACSTSSRTTSSASSTSRTRPSRRSAACSRATARASRRSSTTASGCRARWTTGRRPSTSSSRARRRSCSSRPRRASSSATTRPRSSSRSCARPGIVDPRGRGARDQEPDRRPDERDPQRAPRRGERTLVTTLTKKMAEDLTDYLLEYGFRVRYLHSEIDTLERIQIIRELRLGEFDVLVGVNLLREGLDLPEVSLVAIIDADKEGFLRGETSLIQTIGRAARNIKGKVIMYADKESAAMRNAISRDRPPPRDPGRLQRGARHHARDDPQGHLRHHRLPVARVEGARRARAPAQAPPRRGHVRRGDQPDDGRARGGDARWRPTTCASSTRPSCATRSRRLRRELDEMEAGI